MHPVQPPSDPSQIITLPVPSREGASRFGWHWASDFGKCETLWMHKNLTPHPDGGVGVEPTRYRPALETGSIFHAMVAAWYLSGCDLEWPHDTGVRSTEAALVAGRLAARATGEGAAEAYAAAEQLFLKYAAHYGQGGPGCDYPALQVAFDDAGPLVEREFWLDLGYRGYLFTARLDLVMQDEQGALYAVEHKTTAGNQLTRLQARFRLDGQASGQLLQLQSHYPGRTIGGGILNAAVKDRSEKSKDKLPTFSRTFIDRTDDQLEKFTMDLRSKLLRIDGAIGYYKNLLERGMSPSEAGRVVFDGSPDGYQCVSVFGECDFYQLCLNRSENSTILHQDYRPRAYAHRWENPLALEQGSIPASEGQQRAEPLPEAEA